MQNWRDICLMSLAAKLCNRIILNRIHLNWYDTEEKLSWLKRDVGSSNKYASLEELWITLTSKTSHSLLPSSILKGIRLNWSGYAVCYLTKLWDSWQDCLGDSNFIWSVDMTHLHSRTTVFFVILFLIFLFFLINSVFGIIMCKGKPPKNRV